MLNKTNINKYIIFLMLISCTRLSTKDNRNNDFTQISKYYHSGNYDSCIIVAKKYLSEGDSSFSLLNLISSSYLALEEDSLASYYADISLLHNRAQSIPYCNKGIILDRKKEHVKAQGYYLKSIKNDSSLAQAYSNLTSSYIYSAKYDSAVYYGEIATGMANMSQDKAILCIAYHFVGNNSKRDSLLHVLEEENYINISSLKDVITGS